MKINKNKLSVVLIYFAFALLSYCLIISIRQIEYTLWLRIMGGYVIFHSIVSFLCLYKVKVKLFSLSGFFIAFSYIFHFGQVILKAIAPNYKFTIVDYTTWLNSNKFINSIEFSLIVITAVVIGMILISKEIKIYNINYNINKEVNINYKKMGIIILTITFPIKLILDIKSIIISRTIGYVEMLDMEVSGVLYQISYFYVIGIIFLLIAYRKNSEKARILLVIACIYNLISMMSGGRGRAIINILLFIYIYYSIIKKIKLRQIINFILIGFFGMLFLNAITHLRATGIDSISEIIKSIVLSNNNPIFTVIEEFGSTIYTVYQSMVFVPNRLEYSFGATYIYSLSQMFININGILNDVTQAASFSRNINSGYALGGSYIGELYYNFGYFSGIVAIFIGAFVNKISFKIEGYIANGLYYKLSYYIMLFINIIWWVRSAFTDLVRSFVWGAIMILVIRYITKKVVLHK